MTNETDSRAQSAIGFPYVDLQGAIEVARAVLDAGGVPLERDQLAGAMNAAPGSGAFSIKIGATRLFGLMEVVGGKNQLTPLGFEILDPARQKAAMAEAFLNVPLYKRVYEEFKGRQLPPRPQGLEQAFVNFGVAPKQKDKARHVFDRSARLAGFFLNANEDRLVMPVTANVGLPEEESARTPSAGTIHTLPLPPVAPPSNYHPFIEGLLKTLPPEGAEWPVDRRAKWLEAASNIFDLIYKGSGGAVLIAAEPASRTQPDD